MSIFNRKKKTSDDESQIVIPQVVTSQPSPNNNSAGPTQSQLAQQMLDVEQSRIESDTERTKCICNTISSAAQGIRDIAGFVADCRMMSEKSEQLRMVTNVQLETLIAKYKLTESYMERSFGERSQALSAHYRALDIGVAKNDRDQIIQALQGISGIVAQSPLQDIDKFTALFNDTSKTLLDF